ncbi:ATP-binding protein [Amycolatopsis sp. NPDC059021]|uniref:GAF domain-containing sensor histidine kinase n=1 Tax=Amycolatopsis sp. NPDC059021 TaxID=3346704 RepID=UPI00366CF014
MIPNLPRVESAFDHADSLLLLERETRVLDLLASGAELGDVLGAVTEALNELLPYSRCSILLLDSTRATLHHGAASGLPAHYVEAIDGLSIGPEAGSCGTSAYHGIQVVVEDIATDRRWDDYRALAELAGLRSCWSQPVLGRDGGVLGTFAVYHTEPHLPPEREVRLVEQFTHLASVAIEHARLFGALAESEERFRRAFEDNAVGMALVGLDRRFTRVNRALRHMLGLSEVDLLGVELGAVLRPDLVEHTADILTDLVDGDADNVQFETVCVGSGGAEIVAAATASIVRRADGEKMYLSLNLLDITQRRAADRERRARREAEVARHAAEESNRAKSEFLTSLSHELRTPMQAITGFAELLRRLDLPAERRQSALHHITEASDHILALVDDVLDVAKIEAGALEVRPEPLELRQLVGEVVALLEPLSHHRISLRVEGPERRISADRRRLRQVLINLVTNAIRHNEPDGWVLVETAETADGALIRVTDSGPGISPELLERLFVPFQRLDAEARGVPGAGLGLVLARGLTEAMGGTLRLTSTPGTGTSVEVALPAG